MMRLTHAAAVLAVTLFVAGCAQPVERAAAPAAPAAAAAPAAPAAAQVAQAPAADPNRMICRKDEATGSRLRSTRVCKTQAEWDQARDDARRAADQAQRERGNQSRIPMGGG